MRIKEGYMRDITETQDYGAPQAFCGGIQTNVTCDLMAAVHGVIEGICLANNMQVSRFVRYADMLSLPVLKGFAVDDVSNRVAELNLLTFGPDSAIRYKSKVPRPLPVSMHLTPDSWADNSKLHYPH